MLFELRHNASRLHTALRYDTSWLLRQCSQIKTWCSLTAHCTENAFYLGIWFFLTAHCTGKSLYLDIWCLVTAHCTGNAFYLEIWCLVTAHCTGKALYLEIWCFLTTMSLLFALIYVALNCKDLPSLLQSRYFLNNMTMLLTTSISSFLYFSTFLAPPPTTRGRRQERTAEANQQKFMLNWKSLSAFSFIKGTVSRD